MKINENRLTRTKQSFDITTSLADTAVAIIANIEFFYLCCFSVRRSVLFCVFINGHHHNCL